MKLNLIHVKDNCGINGEEVLYNFPLGLQKGCHLSISHASENKKGYYTYFGEVKDYMFMDNELILTTDQGNYTFEIICD